jgi:hypothetical protein
LAAEPIVAGKEWLGTDDELATMQFHCRHMVRLWSEHVRDL